METIFPTATGYQGLFLVSHRKNPADETLIQRTGTVLLKRTYAISPSNAAPTAGQVTPALALPIFLQDQPNGLIANGDFEMAANGIPTGWQADANVTIAQTPDPVDPPTTQKNVMRVTSNLSGVNGRVTQTVTFPMSIAGRRFGFSFKARADAVATLTNVRLEAGGQSICAINAALTTGWQTFAASALWPTAVNTTQIEVVLRMATDANRTIYYDDVTLHSLLYEHDLAAFKPQGDVIVLGFTAGVEPTAIQIDNQQWFARDVVAGDPDLFGWQFRDEHPRQDEGSFTSTPLTTPLPSGFKNLYYNGYRRAARQVPSVPFLPAAASVLITRNTTRYGFALAGETIDAAYFYYPGVGSDEECAWRKQAVPMNLDTLVIEPNLNRCYTVWRGVWNFDVLPVDAYRRLVVETN